MASFTMARIPPPEGPSPEAFHSRESTFTPVKRTVQPPLAVTIWLPTTFNWGGAAWDEKAEQIKTNPIKKEKKGPVRNRFLGVFNELRFQSFREPRM